MNKLNIINLWRNIKNHTLLLLSVMACLCLFLSPTLLSLIISTMIFFMCLVLFSLVSFDRKILLTDFEKFISKMIVYSIEIIGLLSFVSTWIPSSKVGVLSNYLGLSKFLFLLLIGIAGCLVAYKSVKVLVEYILLYLKDYTKGCTLSNLKNNWYMSLSMIAFFCLYSIPSVSYITSLFFVIIISLIISAQNFSLKNILQRNHIVSRIMCLLTTFGICLTGQSIFYETWSPSSKLQSLQSRLFMNVDIALVVGIVGGIISTIFVYCCVMLIWKEIYKIVNETKLFKEIEKKEIIIYMIIIILSLSYVTYSFLGSEAFYGSIFDFDIIYTSDSPALVGKNIYLNLTHPENDLRQPLFAVFSAPFIGIPYLLGRVFNLSHTMYAILINCIQVIIMHVSNYMLAKIMDLNVNKRICFIIFSAATYTSLLFMIMMEQYIFAYFWLILCIYVICKCKDYNHIVLFGAGGSLLTSLAMMPIFSNKSPINSFKEWIADMIKLGVEFLLVMLLFCRFDVIYNLITKVNQLSGFTGETLTLVEKVQQYFAFISSCFFAPSAGISYKIADHISWQLNEVASFNIIGIIIILLCAVSVIVNKEKRSSIISFYWIIFSVAMLVILGWGTQENGLILYALYFGWAFNVLLFQLVEKIRIKRFFHIVCFSSIVGMLAVNVPAIMEMLEFAFKYFPA